MLGSLAIAPVDALRLLTVPALCWVGLRDHRTRRVPKWVWWPLGAVGVVCLLVDGVGSVSTLSMTALVVTLGVVLGFVGPIGLADTKALVVIALVFPRSPDVLGMPVFAAPAEPLILTVVANAALLALAYPLSCAGRNAARGRFDVSMGTSIAVPVASLSRRYGRLVRPPVDLDVLRAFQAASGARLVDTSDDTIEAFDHPRVDDETLRAVRERIREADHVLVRPGIPLLVPIVGGLVSAIVLGDLLGVVVP